MNRLAQLTSGGRVLVAGNGLAQVIGVLAAPIITRLYSTEEFGYLTMFVSVFAVLGLVASLRYDQAILAASDEETAGQLLGLTIVVSVIGGGMLLLPLSVFAIYAESFAGLPSGVLRFAALLLPVGLAGVGVFQGLLPWATRRKEFRNLAVARVWQSLVGALVQVVGGAVWGTYHLLLLGHVFSRVAGIGTLWKIRPFGFPKGLSWKILRREAHSSRRFPLWAGPASILNSSALLLPTILLGATYGSSVAGWFGLGQRVVGIPMFVIGAAAANVYAANFSAARPQGRAVLRQLMARTILRLLPVAVLVLIGSFVARPVFALVFGAEWITAGSYVSILAVPFALQLLTSPVSITANLVNRQDLQLFFDGVRIAAVVAVLTLAPRFGADAATAVGWLSIVLAVTYVAYLALYWSLLRGDEPI